MYTAMIVEDEYLLRLGIRSAIDESGLPITVTGMYENTLTALEMVNKKPPDILFTALQLPGINGFELIKRVRASGHNCRILIVAYLESFSFRKQIEEFGISGFMFKPSLTKQIFNDMMGSVVDDLDKDIYRAIPSDHGIEKNRKHRNEIKRVLNYINENISRNIYVCDLAEIAGFSGNYLSNVFSKEYGISLQSYINNLRLERSKELLLDANLSMVEIAGACGYNDESYFSKCFKLKYGVSPSQWRRHALREAHGSIK